MATPRKRHPSDEKRLKNEPHIRVGFSIRNPKHPEQSAVFADPALRGIWLGVLVIAGQAFAGRDEDWVTLTESDLYWITGRKLWRSSWPLLRQVAATCGWVAEVNSATSRPTCRVHIRNLSQNQGWGSANRGIVAESTPRSPLSYSDSESSLPLKTEEETERPRSPLLNLLSRLEGDAAEKALWLAETGPQIQIDALESKRTQAKPQSEAQLTVRYYRAYLARCQRDGIKPRTFEREAKRRKEIAEARAARERAHNGHHAPQGPPEPMDGSGFGLEMSGGKS